LTVRQDIGRHLDPACLRRGHTLWGNLLRIVARGGAEFDDNAPPTLLDAWLKAAAETRGNRRELKPGNYYQGCIFAWNAYREAKAISSIKFDARKGLHKITE